MKSEKERADALAYFTNNLRGLELYDAISATAFLSIRANIFFVGAAGKPENLEFRYGWGSSFSESFDWLVSEIREYLLANDSNLCVIRDMCQHRDDPHLVNGAPGPAWFCQKNVFWPITQDMAERDLIRRSLEWGAFGQTDLIVFCSRPVSLTNKSHDEQVELSLAILEEIADSTVRVVTDVFDQEFYLVCDR